MEIKKKIQKTVSILLLFLILASSFNPVYASSQNIQYYVDVTVTNPNNVTINQTIEINLTDIINWAEVQSDGSDIQISYSGTPLNQELSDFSKASETGILTVQIEDIASESNRTLQLYFGKQKYTSVPGLDSEFEDSSTSSNSREYWIEQDSNGDYWCWIKTNGSENLIVEQTGSYTPDGEAVFLFFDDFSNGLEKWQLARVYGGGTYSATISEGVVDIYADGDSSAQLIAEYPTTLPIRIIGSRYIGGLYYGTVGMTNSQTGNYEYRLGMTSDVNNGYMSYGKRTTSSYTYEIIYEAPATTSSCFENIITTNSYKWYEFGGQLNTVETQDLITTESTTVYPMLHAGQASHLYCDYFAVLKYAETEPEILQDGNSFEIGECSVSDYQVALNVTGIATSDTDSLMITTGTAYDSLELTISEIYVEGGYDLDISANDAVLVNSEYDLLLQPNYAVYQNVVDFGDGTVLTQSSNSFTHIYTATGNYSILIKSYLDASTYFERSLSVLVTTDTQNITVYFKEENDKTEWTENVTVYTPFGTYNTNTTLTDISAINGGYISATDLDGVVRSLYISDSSQYTFYFPENDSYLVEVVLNSYFDDKISVKDQEGSIIYEGVKKISPSLQKGKLYRIYVNDVYYDDFIADSAKEIQVTSSGVSYLDLQFHSYLEEMVFSGSTASGTKEVTLSFSTNETSKNFTYTISTTGYEQTFSYSEIAGYLNLTNATEPTLVNVVLYENTTVLKDYDIYLYPQGTADNPTFLEKGYYVVLILMLLMVLFASKLSLHLALLLGAGIFLLLAYPFNIYRLFGSWNLTACFIGLSIFVFLLYRIWRYPE